MTTIQHTTLFFSILTIIVLVYWDRKNKDIRLYSVPAMLWVGHTIVYYIALILHYNFGFPFPSPTFHAIWSAFLRFHGIFTVFYSILIMSNIVHDIKKGVKALWKR